MSPKVRVTPKEDGAVISVDGVDIIVTVKPSDSTAPTVIAPSEIDIESVRSRLAEYLKVLEIGEEAEGIVVRPKGYLGREKFSLIAAIVEELGGNYISAGKNSRFLISRS